MEEGFFALNAKSLEKLHLWFKHPEEGQEELRPGLWGPSWILIIKVSED